MLQKLLHNHVLANLAFVLVLMIGSLSYMMLPRQQDPTMNFNWIVVTTVLPGASALDVEKKITDPLEDAIRGVSDIKFISSNSRESVSSMLIRFNDIDERTFDKRVVDLRREIENAEDELPESANDSLIVEVTSSNAFPSASLAVVGHADDENLRLQARHVEKDLERFRKVDRVDVVGASSPELQVVVDPKALERYDISPGQVADTVQAFFQDIAAGTAQLGDQNWLVRLVGSDSDPSFLGSRPVIGAAGEVTLNDIAKVQRGREKATMVTAYEGRPAALLGIMKKADANMLELVEEVKAYIDERNQYRTETGVDLVLIDDQTIMTRESISIMQNNAVIGLSLVLVVVWLFLGSRIALLTAIGIPFILTGTFWVLSVIGETLNVTVLLGVVIVLGMLVDDAVVVVESIYYRLRQGMDAMTASIESLREVAQPVFAAVMTTMAAFLPLMLLPGILGDYMMVIPMVVTIALAISLVEAFWMLPAHVVVAKVNFRSRKKSQIMRERLTHWIQINYVRLLIKVMRRTGLTLTLIVLLFLSTFGIIAAGLVKMDFFASDPLRIFYVNVEMPPGTPVKDSLAKAVEIENKVRRHLKEGEARAMISYGGQMFTETAPRLGEFYGQVMVGLNPKTNGMRSVDEIMDAMREDVINTPGPVQVSFLRMAGGPPTSKPISVKVRGDDYDEIRRAADTLKAALAKVKGIKDIEDDASRGRSEMVLMLDVDAVNRANLNPLEISRALQILVNGLVVTDIRDRGEKVEVRIMGPEMERQNIGALLDFRMPLPDGTQVPLSQLVSQQRNPGLGNVRHYNFRRAITVEADIEEEVTDTVKANKELLAAWEKVQDDYPNIDLDFTGELDDINEAIDSIGVLFLFGLGLMYLILGTQFKSYWQPFMIIATIPMAFTGVVLGLLISQNPMSLFGLYGVVALAGIAVNAAIVLISAANDRLYSGMSLLHATLYAARRRVIPVLITSLTTIAGLSSLAMGLGGSSLIWGPVATSIVWGLMFSTVLTLLTIPLLYKAAMRGHQRDHLEKVEGAGS